MHRYYLPDFRFPELAPAEAHHCLHVIRQTAGDVITVFDGRGHEAQATIARTDRASVQLTLQPATTSAPLPGRITLAQAIPKQRMDLIVQKATELGVAVIAPLFSERTLLPAGRDLSGKWERWRSISLEACKQSGNNWLPDLLPPRKTADFLAALGPYDLTLIGSLQPEAQPLKQILADARVAPTKERPQEPTPGPSRGGEQHSGIPLLGGARGGSEVPDGAQRRACSVLVLIGPEGDFTPAELALARTHGCHPLSLGPLVLRADTAALYALSILHHELNCS